MNNGVPVTSEAQQCIQLYNKVQPDVVVITGDIYEYNVNPKKIYPDLAAVFPDVPVVCCLGNHEFFYKTPKGTLKDYRHFYDPDKYNVHYLDVVNKVDVDNVRFVGNVLWYDGSMSTCKDQNLYDFAGKRWMDCSILDFDPAIECQNNINKIRDNIDKSKTNILCTHCVPHYKLNGHYSKSFSLINAYSGVFDLLDRIKVQYSFSGHTHWRLNMQLGETFCYNCGNDYYTGGPNFLYNVVEV